MRLLICTQRVDKNDAILGFFHRWLEEFSKHCDKVLVVALEVGEYDLPSNVEVYSLGKEKGGNRVLYAIRFVRYIVEFRRQYDSVFVHMNPEYGVLGGLPWLFWGKRVGLWYTHRAVNLKLRIATFFSHAVFSASPSSFRLATDKLQVLGHGIDTGQFSCPERGGFQDPLRIIAVGRISVIKGQKTIVEAARILRDRKVAFHLTFIGAPGDTKRDAAYASDVHAMVESYGLSEEVVFAGSIPNPQMVKEYCAADIALNLVPEGGLDKTVIEAMAAGVVPITSNSGYREHMGPYKEMLVTVEDDPSALADRIAQVRDFPELVSLREHLVGESRSHFSVTSLIPKIMSIL